MAVNYRKEIQMAQLKFPIGIENFKKIRTEGYYYVDKTDVIRQILDDGCFVTLFTRPRRFGKSLNMSMLRHFFEIGTNSALFSGLSIAENHELCQNYMGKFPVVSISLKGVNARSYKDAYALLVSVINEEVGRFQFLLESDKLTKFYKTRLEALLDEHMTKSTLIGSLRKLTILLEKYYGQQVIVLIDEYDVPLAKANENGYYEDMVFLIRGLFENVLKTNDSLKFSVLTGCLRVAKESIFTGLNNFKVCSITDSDFDETFGFTDSEVKSILQYYGQKTHYTEVKEWYDGYRFGKADVYCPWDVLNYCRDLLKDEQAQPKNYWLNTSGNDVIEHFIDSVNGQQTLTKIELERLISGEIVQKEINEFITYKELYNTSENLWSTLFMTGYLTQRGKADGNRYNLVIPNREVRNIITEHILVRFRQDIKKDGQMVQRFCHALANGQAQQVEQIFATYMSKTVSVRDTFVRKAIRENFYHGILLGILSFKDGWTVTSNRESGNGFSDILIQIDDSDTGIVIEVKYTEEGKSMESDCKAALKQIDEKNYTETLYQAGVKRILKYGIACQIKDCKVILEEE